MNLDYWLEQIKATAAIAAHLAVPISIAEAPTPTPAGTARATATTAASSTPATSAAGGLYLPMILKDA